MSLGRSNEFIIDQHLKMKTVKCVKPGSAPIKIQPLGAYRQADDYGQGVWCVELERQEREKKGYEEESGEHYMYMLKYCVQV